MDDHEDVEVDATRHVTISTLIEPRHYGLVLACGGREWSDPRPIRQALACIAINNLRFPGRESITVLHGGARGADKLVGTIAHSLGLRVRVEIADWVDRGRGAGHERNRRMLDLNPSIVLAFKDGFDRTMRAGGTENMCRIAIGAGVSVILYEHARGWTRLAIEGVKTPLLTVRADG